MTNGKTIKHSRLRYIFAATLLTVMLGAPAFATTVVRLNMKQLIQRSDLIIQGHVQSVYSKWDETRHLVFTYVSIRVDESLKGEHPTTVLIRQVGGTVGTIQMSVAGVPQFRSGEMALVFLKRQDDGSFQVVGMNQGLYEIVDDFAVSNVFGVDLMDSRTGEIGKPLIGGRVPLMQLKTNIRELQR